MRRMKRGSFLSNRGRLALCAAGSLAISAMFVSPVLGQMAPGGGGCFLGIACQAKSLALGGATIGTDALGVTGTVTISGNATLNGQLINNNQTTTNGLLQINTRYQMAKTAAFGAAPGAGLARFEVVTGTTGGSCKLQVYAGTSATPVTIIDNVGSGC